MEERTSSITFWQTSHSEPAEVERATRRERRRRVEMVCMLKMVELVEGTFGKGAGKEDPKTSKIAGKLFRVLGCLPCS